MLSVLLQQLSSHFHTRKHKVLQTSYRHNPQKSPCAESAPASVYGHTGFTGTCAWTDPENGLVYVFLSNRTYPDVWNNKLMRLDIRTGIQEAVYKAMLGGKK